MIISSIVAVGKNHEIGVDNDLPWHLPADLKFFKKTTKGHHVLMGRKCFDSIGRPLPGRTNIVVTRNKEWYRSDVEIEYSIMEGIDHANKHGEDELFILGGGNIYAQTMNICDRLYVTHVEAEIPDANVFFPKIDLSIWKEVSKEAFKADNENIYDFCFSLYERI